MQGTAPYQRRWNGQQKLPVPLFTGGVYQFDDLSFSFLFRLGSINPSLQLSGLRLDSQRLFKSAINALTVIGLLFPVGDNFVHFGTARTDRPGNKTLFGGEHGIDYVVWVPVLYPLFNPTFYRHKDLIMSSLRSHNGLSPSLGSRVYIDPASVVIGDVQLGDDCSIWPMAVVRGDMHQIRIGQRCSIQDGAVLHITHASDYNPAGWPLSIGDDVTIGHKAVLHGCTVGSRVLVGVGAIVMDGAMIEDEVIVGAGCMVPPGKTLESGYVYVGNPAKQLRLLSDKERQFFRYTAGNYVKLKDQYLSQQLPG